MIHDRQVRQLQAGFAARGFLRVGECGKQQAQAKDGRYGLVLALQKRPGAFLDEAHDLTRKEKGHNERKRADSLKEIHRILSSHISSKRKFRWLITNESGKHQETYPISRKTGSFAGYHPRLALSSDSSHRSRRGFRKRKQRSKTETRAFGRPISGKAIKNLGWIPRKYRAGIAALLGVKDHVEQQQAHRGEDNVVAHQHLDP